MYVSFTYFVRACIRGFQLSFRLSDTCSIVKPNRGYGYKERGGGMWRNVIMISSALAILEVVHDGLLYDQSFRLSPAGSPPLPKATLS